MVLKRYRGQTDDGSTILGLNSGRARDGVAGWLIHCSDPLGSKFAAPRRRLAVRHVRKLFLKADAHKVLPSVLRHYPLQDADAKLEQIWHQADARRVEAAALSAMLRHHASEIIDAAGHMPVAIVKGPTFAALYPPGLRPFGDIDLLAPPAALSQLASILSKLGFKRLEESNPGRLEDAWLHRDNRILMVEVHTNLVHSNRMRAAFSLTYDDLNGSFDRPAGLLTIAVMHGTMHFFAWLRHVVDICQAARAVTTSAEESLFVALVERTGTRMAAVVGLTLAHRLFGEERCQDVARTLGATRDFRFARTLIDAAVLSAPSDGWFIYNTWRRFMFRELMRRGSMVSSERVSRTASEAPL